MNKLRKIQASILAEKSNPTLKHLEHSLNKFKSKNEKLEQKHQKQTSEIRSLQLKNSQMIEKYNKFEMGLKKRIHNADHCPS